MGPGLQLYAGREGINFCLEEMHFVSQLVFLGCFFLGGSKGWWRQQEKPMRIQDLGELFDRLTDGILFLTAKVSEPF